MKFSEYGSAEAVKFLLNNGAEIDGKNINGKTALMYASERGHIASIKLLIQNQADVSLRDNQNQIASNLASTEQVSNFLRTYKLQ